MSVSSGSPADPATDGRGILIVGAGPTGLALAVQLLRFGVPFRIIDRSLDRVHESRALAVQARTVEILQTVGLAETLLRRGNRGAQVILHFDRANTARVDLAEFKRTDTRFPFILFVSQAETEAVLEQHLHEHGAGIERGVELIELDRASAACKLRHRDGREESITPRFVAGCDGAHSAVRKHAGIDFQGDAYLQQFMLGDVEIDGPLEPNTLHAFPGDGAIAVLFPLGSPRTWRVIATAVDEGVSAATVATSALDQPMVRELSLEELQSVLDIATGGTLALRDPAWLAHFRLHHRQARHYRDGAVFLAGDAAHIHSPVGAQGMNTGIQDAWNLGWKVALVLRGHAHPMLLDSYEAERWPIGRFLLRYTDRIFGTVIRGMSRSRSARMIRRRVLPYVAPYLLRAPRVRRAAFDFISELGIHYRQSPAVEEGTPPLRLGPRAGDRIPDLVIEVEGQKVHLQDVLAGARIHLLLCGTAEGWDRARVAGLVERYPRLLEVHYVGRDPSARTLVDHSGDTLAQLGVRDGSTAQYLVRPDGHIGFRCGGQQLEAAERYLGCWFCP